MISLDTKEYLETWNKKIEDIHGTRLNQAFEKFESLLKIYGRLANEISAELLSKKALSKTGGDQMIATKNIILCLKSEFLIEQLTRFNNEDIEHLHRIIHRFHISFSKEGVSLPDIDTKLVGDLKSDNPDIKSLSILQIIYFVRCNNIHSRKGYAANQILLLQPINKLLATLNKLLYDELNK